MRAVHWFRHDLRLRDNAALTAACEQSDEIIPVFILDDRLLRGARSGHARNRFLLDCLARLARDLETRGARLILRRGEPVAELARLLDETHAGLLTFGRAQAPAAMRRDARVRAVAAKAGVRVIETKDHVVFESHEVLSTQARPFAVYTPYRRAWERAYDADPQTPLRAPKLPPTLQLVLAQHHPRALPPASLPSLLLSLTRWTAPSRRMKRPHRPGAVNPGPRKPQIRVKKTTISDSSNEQCIPGGVGRGRNLVR